VNASLSGTDIESQLRGVLAEVCGRNPSQLGADVDLVRALGLDSLALLRLVAEVEVRLGVRFPDSALSQLRTIRQFAEAIVAGKETSLSPSCGESSPLDAEGRGA
jgi:acyl carrier protein